MLVFIRGTQKPDIFTLECTFLSKLIHFGSVDYFKGAAVSQSSRRFKEEIEGTNARGKSLKG